MPRRTSSPSLQWTLGPWTTRGLWGLNFEIEPLHVWCVVTRNVFLRPIHVKLPSHMLEMEHFSSKCRLKEALDFVSSGPRMSEDIVDSILGCLQSCTLLRTKHYTRTSCPDRFACTRKWCSSTSCIAPCYYLLWIVGVLRIWEVDTYPHCTTSLCLSNRSRRLFSMYVECACFCLWSRVALLRMHEDMWYVEYRRHMVRVWNLSKSTR